uniref:Uncharacterized protein n=1 Tax=Arundo donax TaxID=35708 RepID=A0A0A9BTM2_ARUDO
MLLNIHNLYEYQQMKLYNDLCTMPYQHWIIPINDLGLHNRLYYAILCPQLIYAEADIGVNNQE